MNRFFVMAVLVFLLAACGTLVDDGTGLLFKTADPRLNIGFRLLPAPVPLPTVTPDVNPCIDVKGNIASDGRKLYHLPGMRNYNQVVIDEAAGERIFCTEQDAIDAGWTKAGN